MQWGKSIPSLNEIFNKLAEKIDDVKENINAIREDLISKADYTQKTADNALNMATDAKRISKEYKEKFGKIEHYCGNLEAENHKTEG